MKAEDRNTAITISIVLIVCLVSLFVIGSFLWQLVAPGFDELGRVLGQQTFSVRADYNFDVITEEELAQIEEEMQSSTTSEERAQAYNYNFNLPPR